MPDAWTGGAVGRMHVYEISHIEVAKRMGVRREYLSMILNGKRHPPGAEERVNRAIDEIVSERNAQNKAE